MMGRCPECHADAVETRYGRASCTSCSWWVELDPDADDPGPIVGQLDLDLDAPARELVVPAQSNVIPF